MSDTLRISSDETPAGMMTDNHHAQLIIDTGLATASLLLPPWVYQASALAGVITALVGMLLVIVRFLIALREWRNPSPRIKEPSNVTSPGNSQS